MANIVRTCFIPHTVLSAHLDVHPAQTLKAIEHDLGLDAGVCEYDRHHGHPDIDHEVRVVVINQAGDPGDLSQLVNTFATISYSWVEYE